MRKNKVKRATSWLIAAAMASSICGFEASAAAPVGTQITSTTTELEAEGTYWIGDAVGLKRLAELVNTPQQNGTKQVETGRGYIDEEDEWVPEYVTVPTYKSRVAANTETPTEPPTIGNIYQGGAHIFT